MVVPAVALVGGLALATVRETVPTGGAASMPSMRMQPGADHLGISLRDVDGRPMRMPDGRAGAVLVMATHGCGDCLNIAKRLDAAASRAPSRPAVALVGVDTEEGRQDFERFDRAAGGLDARYALDDASGSITRLLGARELGTVVVYDPQGMVIERVRPGTRQATRVEAALGIR